MPLGYSRSTRPLSDLDILIRADAENARAGLASFGRFGAPLAGMTAVDFAEEGPFFRMGNAPIGVGILTRKHMSPAVTSSKRQ